MTNKQLVAKLQRTIKQVLIDKADRQLIVGWDSYEVEIVGQNNIEMILYDADDNIGKIITVSIKLS